MDYTISLWNKDTELRIKIMKSKKNRDYIDFVRGLQDDEGFELIESTRALYLHYNLDKINTFNHFAVSKGQGIVARFEKLYAEKLRQRVKGMLGI